MVRLVRRPVARRFRAVALLAVVAMALLVAGCLGIGDDSAKLRQQARTALTRWADAVAAAGPSPVVLVGELTGQVGVWEPAVGDNNKRALMAGLVEADASLPATTPPDGEVRWQDETTAPVALISAQQAVAAIKAGTSEPCGDDCTPLRITAARLTTGPIETSRGPATAPIWDLTVDGTAVIVTRPAIAGAIAIALPPWNPDDPSVGVAIDSASVTGDGRQLTVAFVGAPLPGDQPCGEDYTAEAVESDIAIVVIVTRHPHVTIGACTGVGAPRTATLNLAAPLGDRTVLEVQQGRPVPVTLTP